MRRLYNVGCEGALVPMPPPCHRTRGFTPLREKIAAYIGGQCLGLELVAKGILNHNPEKLAWGEEVLGRAPEHPQEIALLSRDLY